MSGPIMRRTWLDADMRQQLIGLNQRGLGGQIYFYEYINTLLSLRLLRTYDVTATALTRLAYSELFGGESLDSSTSAFVVFARKDQFAAVQWPLNATPGGRAVRHSTAIAIIAPSSTRKSVSLFQSSPSKPPQSSATRKTDRARITMVDRRMLAMKALKSSDCRVRILAGSWSSMPRLERIAKSAMTIRNTARLTACSKRPAIMMSTPVCRDGVPGSEVSAMAPPIACSSNDRKSDVMNAIATVRGAKRELC
jgi:hypothetical protein